MNIRNITRWTFLLSMYQYRSFCDWWTGCLELKFPQIRKKFSLILSLLKCLYIIDRQIQGKTVVMTCWDSPDLLRSCSALPIYQVRHIDSFVSEIQHTHSLLQYNQTIVLFSKVYYFLTKCINLLWSQGNEDAIFLCVMSYVPCHLW
jgi:hypothetical protein